jgi:hypothetical protein
MILADANVFEKLKAYSEVVQSGKNAAKAAQNKKEAENWDAVIRSLEILLEHETNSLTPSAVLLLDVDCLTKEQRTAMLAAVKMQIDGRGEANLKTVGFRDSRQPPGVFIEMKFFL